MKTLALALATVLAFTVSANAVLLSEDFTAQTTGVPPSGPNWSVTTGPGTTANVIDIGGTHGHVLQWADPASDAAISATWGALPAIPAGTLSFDMYIPDGQLNSGYFDFSMFNSASGYMLDTVMVRSALAPANDVFFQSGYGGDRPMVFTIPNDDVWLTFTIGWGAYSGVNPILTLDVADTSGPLYSGSFTNIYFPGLGQTPDHLSLFEYATVNTLIMDGVLFDNFRIQTIPEPASMALLGLGGLMLMRRRRA